MPTHLYGILLDRNAHRVPATLEGVAGSKVRLIRGGPLAALASSIEGEAPDSMEAFQEHERVLTTVVERGASVVSVRYRQRFADDDEARAHLARNERGLVDLLERQDGCVEMHLLLGSIQPSMWDFLTPPGEKREPAAAAAPHGRGRAYLEKLKAEAAALHPQRFSLLHVLGSVVQGERFDSGADGRADSFAHLVRFGDVPAYHAAVARHEQLRGRPVVGPLPFYSFAASSDE